MAEAALVQAAINGDREAFAGLVRLHQARLRALAALSLPNRDDVHDVVHEAFIDAWRGLATFDAGRDFGPWLRTICRNRVAKFLRDRVAQRRRELALVDAALIAQASDGDDELAERRLAALRGCIDALDETQQRLLALRYREEVAVGEIAATLGKSPNGVSMALIRLKAALMKCVAGRLGAGA